jgi:hypothetical protein
MLRKDGFEALRGRPDRAAARPLKVAPECVADSKVKKSKKKYYPIDLDFFLMRVMACVPQDNFSGSFNDQSNQT